jgi:hypothetical protein
MGNVTFTVSPYDAEVEFDPLLAGGVIDVLTVKGLRLGGKLTVEGETPTEVKKNGKVHTSDQLGSDLADVELRFSNATKAIKIKADKAKRVPKKEKA